MLITNQTDVKELLNTLKNQLLIRDLTYKYTVGIRYIEIYFANSQVTSGGTFKELPDWVKNKRAIINIQNKDDKCFLYSVLADLYPTSKEIKNPNRVSNYDKYLDKLDYQGFELPMKVKDICKFETKNNLAINVYTITNKKIVTSHVSNKDHSLKRINLMLHDGHYSYIKSINALLGHDATDNRSLFCDICCTCNFKSKQALENHKKFCITNNYQRLEMPKQKEENEKIYISFNKHVALNKLPIRIYGDFEAIQDYNDTKISKNGNTSYYSKHKAASFKILIVSDIPLIGFDHKKVNDKYIYDYLYRGEKPAYEFASLLMRIKDALNNSINSALEEHEDYKTICMNSEQKQEYNKTRNCPCCKCVFDHTNYKCRHHNHFTGDYIMPLCRNCNLKANLKRNNIDIPVIFHNSNYDKNLFLTEFGKFYNVKEISVIPDNTEKFKYFKVGQYSFIDSFRFMSSGLEKLINNIPKDKRTYLRSLCETEEQFKYLNGKGIFPYEWFDSIEKFDYPITELKKESFKSEIKRSSGCSEEEYDELLETVEALNIKTFGEYHDIYLHKDVNGLADVFESFIELSIKTYKLDPCFFVGTPSYGWSAMLLLTNVKLENLTDIEMYEFYEAGIRGGQSIIMSKKFKANNKYLEDYNPNKPSSYLYYGDANNLYGWAMSLPLPIGGFTWLKNPELFDIESLREDEGATLEVDLRYPEELHDYHNDYPLAPEKIKLGNCEKLCGTLHNKKNYVIDYRNLKLYLSLGLELTKIHRVITYKQQAWLKPWIDKNTDLRKLSKNDFEKDYYKLMNNAVFGKTMENVRNRVKVKLPTTLEKAQKYSNKPNCTKWEIIHNEMVLVSLKEESVKLDKPIYAGFSILDLSKYLMYDFYYNIMKPKYKENLKLLATDTDSFFFAVYTEDLYNDIWEMREHFDMSEYSKENPLHDETNKKVIGKFKDELGDKIMSEFIGVRPKCYSYKKYSMKDGYENVKKLKGVPSAIVKTDIKHDDYDKCVSENKPLTCKVHGIRSSKLQNYTIKQSKTALSNTDDKRYWDVSLGFSSLALGHYRINN
ncbi:hypothetical protein GUITHDRAFT_175435 [Guillardia theta CCMP2712]|uniref:DNA-directed DNA polymerase n=1 Tax=Guillardia theta (strain CCMP2712) TaxID=905079 RepID=L1J7V1_GUITC|nr:hypothetical protein GUITHDRAFT_175435 [Guillardia theta CCMP2712]EKX44397.1 hypothetical protein GUITHDRAFT_175435 [Guillardia theta CCMP2712]|eukprot:XP_005831377.1 hypothetical protein GUITHDRAFT_175435 [Guillardia theta CCMP2712]